MVDLLTKGLGGGALLLGLMPGTAAALPWDIDMVDGYFYRAYEWSMQEMPEGVVARNPRGTRGAEAYASNASWGNNVVAGGMYLDGLTREVCNDPDAVARLDEAQALALSSKMYQARDEADDLAKRRPDDVARLRRLLRDHLRACDAQYPARAGDLAVRLP